MVATRIITGIIGGGLAIFIIYEGGWIFFTMIALLLLGGWFEYGRLIGRKGEKMPFLPLAAWLVVSLTALAFDSYKLLTVLAVLLPLGLFLRTVFQYGKVSPGNSAYALYGTVYICAGFWSLLVLRSGMIGSYFRDDFASVILDPGRFFVFLLVFSTWASDTFAFFAGRAFGKTKLCPAVSPGKTVEGALGGFIGTIVVALIFSAAFQFSLLHGFAIGFLTALAAPLGDLTESALKRVCGVKDSGALIPGHGSILDRFDSLLVAAPVVYAYLTVVA